MGLLIFIAAIIGPKALLRGGNKGLAFLATLGVIIGSALIYTPGIGHGGWLMATIPGSPVIYFVIFAGYKLYDMYQSRAGGPEPSFGRDRQE